MSIDLRYLNNKGMFSSSPFVNHGCNCDLGLYIACVKFEELEDLVYSANYSIVKATDKRLVAFHKTENTALARKALRFHFIKSAILSYQACYDYIVQIAYFGFGFHRRIEKPMEYRSELRHCSFGNTKDSFRMVFKDLLNQTNKIDVLPDYITSAQSFFNQLEDLYDNQRKEINAWANNLKHHGSLSIKELAPKRMPLTVVENALKFNDNHEFIGFQENSKLIPFSDIVQPELLELDEAIRLLRKNNHTICSFSEYLQKQLGLCNLPSKCSTEELCVTPQTFTRNRIEQWLKTKN